MHSLAVAQGRFTPTEYVVGKIKLTGNESFKIRTLKKQMNLKDRFLTRSKTFTRRLIELDRLSLQSYYIKNGYLNCAVRDSFQVLDNGKVDLFYFITEGRQYFLHGIDIDGNTSLDNADILKILDHKLEKPYNPIRIREGIKLLKTEYANIGKPLVLVEDSLDVNEGIHLYIHVTENPTMRIGSVTVKNNQLVKEKPIKREILLKPGDLYSQKKIDLSKKHTFETGLFSSVNIKPYNIDTTNHTLDLQVEVRELDMRYLGGKIGFGQEKGIAEGSEYTSFSLDGQWLHRNIGGRGSRLSLNVGLSVNFTNIFGRPASNASITYIEPWLFGFRSSTSFRLFYSNKLEGNEEETSYGFEPALIYQPDRRVFASVGFVIKKVFWTDLITGMQQDTTTEDNERAFAFKFRRDYRDNFIFPTKGTVFSFDGKIVGMILGGTQDYYWFETSFSQYFPIWRKVIFAYRGKIGYQDTFRKVDALPDYSRFKIGGGSSLRGWYYNTFAENGGSVAVLTNAEIRFPLFWILGSEIFIDGGNLTPDITSLLNTTYRWDAGIGLTIATPLGPIRIDAAKILNPVDRKEKKDVQWQFSIPYAF